MQLASYIYSFIILLWSHADTAKELERFKENFKYEASGFKTLLLVIDQAFDFLTVFMGGVVTLAFFSLATVVVIVASLVYLFCKAFTSQRRCSRKQRRSDVAIYVFIVVGSWMYFVGDNLLQSMKAFRCDETCMTNIKNSSRLLLFVALTCLRIIPLMIEKCTRGEEEKRNSEVDEREAQPVGDRDRQSIGNEHSSYNPQSAGNLQSTTAGNQRPENRHWPAGQSTRYRQATVSCQVPGIQQTTSFQLQTLQRTDGMIQQQQTSTNVVVLCVGEGPKTLGSSGRNTSASYNVQEREDNDSAQRTLLSNFGIVALGLFVDVDLMYTSSFQAANFITTTDPDGMCGMGSILAKCIGVIVFSLFWATFVPLYFRSYKKAISDKQQGCCTPSTIASAIQVVMVMLYSIPYLLADHAHPLACLPKATSTAIRSLLLITTFLITLSTTMILPLLKTIEEKKSCNICIFYTLKRFVQLIKE